MSASWARHSLGISGLWRCLLSPVLPEGHTAHSKGFTVRELGSDAPALYGTMRSTSILRNSIGGGQGGVGVLKPSATTTCPRLLLLFPPGDGVPAAMATPGTAEQGVAPTSDGSECLSVGRHSSGTIPGHCLSRINPRACPRPAKPEQGWAEPPQHTPRNSACLPPARRLGSPVWVTSNISLFKIIYFLLCCFTFCFQTLPFTLENFIETWTSEDMEANTK